MTFSSEKPPKDDGYVIDAESVANEMGSVGRYHLKHYILVLIPTIFTAMFNTNFIFVAREPNYRCKIDQCENNSTIQNMTPAWLPTENHYDFKCVRPVVPNSSFGGESICHDDLYGGNYSLDNCNNWVFEEDDTLVENLDLECSPVQRSLIGTIHYAGMVLSMPLMGLISDRFGRKFAFLCCACGGGIIGLFKAFTHRYYAYAAVEFFEAVVGAATNNAGFVLLVELAGKDKRYLMASFSGLSISCGEFLLGFISKFVPNYKTLIMMLYAPTILFLSYIFLIDESIRWLLTTGRKQRAKKVILKAAKENSIELSSDLKHKLEHIDKLKLEGGVEEKISVDYKQIITSKLIMTRFAISLFWWFTSDVIYYGLLVSAVLLPGDEHQNFMLSSVMGMLGDLIVILTLNRFGRKKTLMASYFMCGVCIVGKAFVPQDQPNVEIALFCVGKMFIGTAYSAVYTYSSELFPTQVRSLLVGTSSMFAGIGAIIAPMTPVLTVIMPQLPSLIFGSLALVSAFLAIFTPETLNVKLPDTLKEAEAIK